MLYESTYQSGPFTDIPAHSKNMLKNTFIDFFYEPTHLWLLRNLFQVFHQLAFKFSINQFLEYRELTKTIAAKLLTNFTFVIQRISKRFLIIFCYTEVLFQGTLNLTERTFFRNKPFRVFKKSLFRNVQEKIFRKTNIVAPNLSNISG